MIVALLSGRLLPTWWFTWFRWTGRHVVRMDRFVLILFVVVWHDGKGMPTSA